MKKLSSPILILAALMAVVAGCGGSGGGSSSSGSPSGEPTGGGGVNGISVGNCLNDQENFLVQPSQTVLDGQSPAGVSFTLTFYKTNAAAAAAFAKKSPKTTSLVENGVIDFKGNPSIYAGAPPAKISKAELNAIKRCIDSAKATGK
ncbi:MAG TPA: hypothetical protein VH210_08370 [Gaiellaceae bacterium]|nr:hypothetical protein [Gaiellaceae bacterium]